MLVIDNDHGFFRDYIQKYIISDAWSIIASERLFLTPSYREEKADLGDHLKRYGGLPKLKGDLIYWVLKHK